MSATESAYKHAPFWVFRPVFEFLSGMVPRSSKKRVPLSMDAFHLFNHALKITLFALCKQGDYNLCTMDVSLRNSQRQRTVLSILLFFVVGIGGPLAVIFGTDLKQIFEVEPTTSAIAKLVAVLVIFPSIAMLGINRMSRRFAAETFDPFFAFLGLTGSSYLRGRQWHGTWQGRQLHIYLNPLQKNTYVPLTTGTPLRLTTYDGHVLEIFMDSAVGTHFALAAGTRVPAMKNEVEGFDVSFSRAKDLAWAKDVLKKVAGPIKELLAAGKTLPMVTVEGVPGAMVFKTHLSKTAFSEKAVKEWVTTLLEITEGIESARKPATIQSETPMERWTRVNRGALHLMGGLGCLLGLVVLLGGIGGLVWALQ